MIRKHLFFVVAFINFTIPFSLYCQCTLEKQREIKLIEPQALYSKIIRMHVSVLQEGFGSTLFKDHVQKLTQYSTCIYDTLKQTISSKNKDILSEVIRIAQFVNEKAQNDTLASFVDQLRYSRDRLITLYLESLKQIDVDVEEVPSEWEESIPSKASSILPNYESFFKNYLTTKNKYNKYNKLPLDTRLPLDQIVQFLNNQSIIRELRIAEKTKFKQFADTLEKLMYRFQEDMKKSWFGSANTLQKYSDLAEELRDGILQHYPGMVTEKINAKVRISTNKGDLASVAGSVSWYNIVMYILKNVQ